MVEGLCGIRDELLPKPLTWPDPLMREVLAAYRKRDGKLLGWKIADFIDIISQYEYAGASLMFARLFKSITGFYVNDYIRQVRIMKAQEFLKGTQMTVNDIAKETGFTTPNYFYSIFKRETGMTPASFREGTKEGEV
ncbi:MAG: helix-turn-helix transcriptional regulator [Lachnospiraceae bacterium]|nr:helix-turn-helix transcriptional regulator [Lachnospiraceae bacterium]